VALERCRRKACRAILAAWLVSTGRFKAIDANAPERSTRLRSHEKIAEQLEGDSNDTEVAMTKASRTTDSA